MFQFRAIFRLVPCVAMALSTTLPSAAQSAEYDFGDFGGYDDRGSYYDDSGSYNDDGGGYYDDGGSYYDDGGFIDVGFNDPQPLASQRICDDGLHLDLQQSNDQYATFTTASIDIALRGIDSVALNRAIAACGGVRNDEDSHAHVDMGASASREAFLGDSCN